MANQLKVLELKIQSLTLDLDEESRRREAAEKRTGVGNQQTTTANIGQTQMASWNQKVNSIQKQEKLEQENMIHLTEKAELQ